jgi:membrane protease YdiL (CAAX protease family)
MSDSDIVVPLDPNVLPPSPPPIPNTIFRGPNGIRAGWRALIFLVIVSICAGALFVIVGLMARLAGGRAQFNASSLTPLGTGLGEGGIFVITAVSALIMARIERRKFGEYGLPAKFAFRRNFWIGGLVGFLAISACLLAIFALHGFHLSGIAIHGKTLLTATAAWSVAFVIVGLAEEFAFRGYLQFTLTTGMGFWPSAILLSALFGLAHAGNPGESKSGLLSVVCFALLFCLFLRRTGNLWWAVGFHAGWDWGQTFFYGVPDSGLAAYHNLFNSAFSGPRWLTGGSVGPEASVFTPIVLLVVAVLFARTYPENQYRLQTSDHGLQPTV